MKAQDFKDWIAIHKFSMYDLEKRFGVTRKTLSKYRDEGGPEWLGYACAAISHGIPAWRQAKDGSHLKEASKQLHVEKVSQNENQMQS